MMYTTTLFNVVTSYANVLALVFKIPSHLKTDSDPYFFDKIYRRTGIEPCPPYYLHARRNVIDSDLTIREHGLNIHVRRQYPPKSYLSNACEQSWIRMLDIHFYIET